MSLPWAPIAAARAARRATGLLASTSGRLSGGGGAVLARHALCAPAAGARGGAMHFAPLASTPAPPSAFSSFAAAALPATRSLHCSTAAAAAAADAPPPPPSATFVRLNSLAPAPGSTRPAKRVGRGIGSGRGKTSGRGHKGQKARSGATPKLGFEGGQTPLGKRLPKRGFVAPGAVEYAPVNVGRLQALVDAGRLDAGRTVTMRDLVAVGAASKKTKHGVKLLGRGGLAAPLRLEVSAASPAARAAVERAGGTVTTVYYNALNLRALLRPGWLARVGRAQPRPARPPPKRAALFDRVGEVPRDDGVRAAAAAA